MFKKRLMKGEDLVLKCSKIKSYDPLKWNYSRKVGKFTNEGLPGWMNGSSMPQVSDSMVGFEVPLHELKQKLKLLQEKDQVLVLSAPPIISSTNTPH
ncbi:hypothetical protein MTR67_010569, partial [Solanum verrucosum]